jgi:AcrR family transcriptional regulator
MVHLPIIGRSCIVTPLRTACAAATRETSTGALRAIELKAEPPETVRGGTRTGGQTEVDLRFEIKTVAEAEINLRFFCYRRRMPASPPTGERPLRRDAQANRERILQAAGQLFSAQGIEVPLDEIARLAGVGTGTFYRHFSDRDHLLDALFAERVQRFDELMASASDADDAWDGLVGLLTTGLELQATDRGLKDILVARARGKGERSQASPETLRGLGDLIERAQRQGELRPDITLADLPLINAALLGVLDLTGEIAPDAWRRILQIVLDGLRAERAAPTPLPHPPPDMDDARAAIAARRGLHTHADEASATR